MSAPRPSVMRHTVRRLAAALLRMAAWFWGIATVVVGLANVVGWLTAGATDVSIAVYARQAGTWFPFSLGIMLVAAYLRVHVASGMTRRTFVRAALLVQVAAAVGYALVLTALVLLERAVHDALGWESVIGEVMAAGSASPTWELLVDLAVVFVAGNMSGLLVGVVYQRGGWSGTLTLPLTVGPLLALMYAAGPRMLDLPGFWSDVSTTELLGLTAAAGVLLAVAYGALFAVLARRAPVVTKS